MVNRETGQIFTSFPMHMSCPYCKGNNHTKDVSIRFETWPNSRQTNDVKKLCNSFLQRFKGQRGRKFEIMDKIVC